MTTQETARAMLTRAGIAYDAHGSGWGFHIGGKFYTPSDAINAVIDGPFAHVGHERGGPGCSETCSQADTRHPGDVPPGWPECCPECGGSGHACYPACTDTRGHAYEPWEGNTGADELHDVGGAVDGMGHVYSDADPGL